MCGFETVKTHLLHSIASATASDHPFRNYRLSNVLPSGVLAALVDELQCPVPVLNGVSGRRELHNDTRRYVDATVVAAFPDARAIAEAYQDSETVDLLERTTECDLEGCCLRIEYAQDTDGFWLEPHTDLGVKKFTLLHYVSAENPDLGTDLYFSAGEWACRFPFADNAGLAFVPASNTFHGFERRPIVGVRRSLIVNYVAKDWRAREQLAFPKSPVRRRRKMKGRDRSPALPVFS